MKKIYLVVLLIAFSSNAIACRVVNWTPEQYAVNSQQVYVGEIQSLSIQGSEITSYIEAYENSSNVDVTLRIMDSLKGESLNIIEFSLSWCGGGEYEINDLVVVYNLGDSWHVKREKEAISISTNVLTR